MKVRNRFLLHTSRALQCECCYGRNPGPAIEHLAYQYHSTAYTGQVATIEVGTGSAKRTFYPHRDLLAFYSGYFRAALNGRFTESRTKVIKLETEEPAVFEGFLLWLYTCKARTDVITEDNAGEYFTSIVKLWIFADRRIIPLMANDMIDHLQQCVLTAWSIPTNTINIVYSNTTEESALRRMLVNMYASLASDDLASIMTHDAGDSIKNFLIDLVRSLIADGPRKPLLTKEQYKRVEMCPRFHVHEEGVKCKKS